MLAALSRRRFTFLLKGTAASAMTETPLLALLVALLALAIIVGAAKEPPPRASDLPMTAVVLSVAGDSLSVEASGTVWQARLANGKSVFAGEVVRIVGRQGLLLMVEQEGLG